MGKSVSRFEMIKSIIRQKDAHSRASSEKGASLSAFRKLGIKDYIQIVLLNPPIKKYSMQIRSILDNGHEIGLHGGKNHQSWADKSLGWTERKLRKEVNWGLRELQKIFPGYQPKGFASPAWVHPELLNKVLLDLGFEYCADLRGEGYREMSWDSCLKFPTTTILGEPGGIAILEHLIAMGASQESVVQEVVDMFKTKSNYIAYDHPYFAGVEALPILSSVVTTLLIDGYEFQTISKITDA
jgi:peptidoglycan/xylan/chitin deacetylase (PgdA/CDA1 family)